MRPQKTGTPKRWRSIAYTVCQHFGIDTSDYSFGYIAGWSTGRDMGKLKSSLMLVFTLVAGVTITSLLLCMWMRSRKREIAVFISMGKRKMDIFMQVFMETAAVFCLSVSGSCVIGSGMAGIMKKLLMEENTAVLLSVSLQARDIATMFFAGGCIAVIAVCISLLPILRANPKDILSKMEG